MIARMSCLHSQFLKEEEKGKKEMQDELFI